MKKALTAFIILFTLLASLFPQNVYMQARDQRQTNGGGSSQEYITGYVYAGNKNTPAPNATLYLTNRATGVRTTQQTNGQGKFAFIEPPGRYSLYGTITGYQSNVCFFDLSSNPIEVTFVLAKLTPGVTAISSCDYTEASSPTPPRTPPPIGDGTEGPAGEVGVTGAPSPGSPSIAPRNRGGGVDCFVTKVGNPQKPSPTLPPECLSSPGGSGTGGGLPGSGLPSGPCQAPPDYPAELRGAIANKWGITINGVPAEQLRAIWEEFWGVDCTGILQDLRGTIIDGTGVNGGISQQIGCPNDPGTDVVFSIYSSEFTKGLILHELTHVWQVCTQRGQQNVLEIPAAYNAEGGVSKYSRNECSLQVGGNWRNEDHADTIALYLNPTIGELTCGNGAPNPFNGGRFPLHRGVAQRGTGR
jgi:hypothetical protein